MRFAVLLLIMISAPTSGMSQTNDLVEVVGMGGQSCAQYVEHKKSAPALLIQLYAQWGQGFLSGYNVGTAYKGKDRGVFKAPVKIPDEATIHLFLEKYCRDHPLGYVTEGMLSLVKELSERNASSTKRMN